MLFSSGKFVKLLNSYVGTDRNEKEISTGTRRGPQPSAINAGQLSHLITPRSITPVHPTS